MILDDKPTLLNDENERHDKTEEKITVNTDNSDYKKNIDFPATFGKFR